MAQSTKIQAACLLLLLIASLASSTLLQQLVSIPGLPRWESRPPGRQGLLSYSGQLLKGRGLHRSSQGVLLKLPVNDHLENSYLWVRQPEALQPQHRTKAQTDRTDRTLLIPKRTKRDSHFPICIFCCYCCGNFKCGVCCKT
ncbi:hepcidin [Cricetulus griseus]|uniref:Hepcidin n=1 Tax=Cricetulus griseus TaxID=10029 RepID=A0A9J7H9W7_CRIGR|nr:hepcidin [Cricetulus griseus]